MPFEYDIFISYGHLDDEDPAGDLKGWVDLLAERLPRVVAGYLGDKPRLWRDEEALSRHIPLDEAILEGIARSRLFVPVVSTRYVKSKWCRRELETFCASSAGQTRSRIFKVVKTPPLPHLKEPEALRDLLGYPFYEMAGDMPRAFSPDTVPAKDQRYWDALSRLAWDITNVLAAPPTDDGRPPDPPPPDDPTRLVYLAEATSDLAKEREQVRDELRQRGYGVLPAQKLPLEERARTEGAVRRDLARCRLSVHLVGARYGSTPEDDPASVVHIQEALAAERGANEPSFRRILWMPPGLATPALEVADARQRAFVAELQTRVTAGSELLQTTIEDLRTRVVEKLAAIEEEERRKKWPPPPRKLKQVYLICENSDRELVKPIKQYLLKDEKFEVITWLDGAAGVTERLMEYHRKNLRECDAALIYFGSGDEPWVRKNLEDLEKAYGYGREVDWSAGAVYVAAPPDEWKEDFDTNMVPLVIRKQNEKKFESEHLREFVSAVRAEGGAR